jgi:HEAT repeat protein
MSIREYYRAGLGQGYHLLALPLLLLAGSAARGQDAAPEDPVESLRRALDFPFQTLAARDRHLQGCVARLRTLDEFQRALRLYEWRDRDAAAGIAEVDARHRASVVASFEGAVRRGLASADTNTQLETINLLAGLDPGVRGVDAVPLARSFTRDLVALTRRDPPVLREAAIRALGQISLEARVAGPALSALFQDPDPMLRTIAAEALVRLTASWKLAQAPSPETVVPLATVVVQAAGTGSEDPSSDVRRLCMEAIGRSAAALGGLVREPAEAADVEDWRAYHREIDAERAAVQPLVQALRQQTRALARAAADGDVSVRVVARKALEEVALARLRLRRRASAALVVPEGQGLATTREAAGAFLQADPLLETLRPALTALAYGVQDPDPRSRHAAIDVLETMGDAAAPAVPALVQALYDRDRFVRWAAARALGRVRPANPATVVPHLAQLLKARDPEECRMAAVSLTTYGAAARAALPELLHAAGSADPQVRVAVLRALESIGSAESGALAVIAASVRDPDPRVRAAASEAVQRLGPDARTATEALVRPGAVSGDRPKTVGRARPQQ